MSTTLVKFKLRRGTAAELANTILLAGEPAYATDTHTLKIGDGSNTTWQNLPVLNSGPTGPTGPKGDTGDIGPTGPTGAIGPAGPSNSLVYSTPTGVNGSSDLSFANNTLTVNGNLDVNGDGNLTGSVGSRYLTLKNLSNPAEETYLWADNDNLLWQKNNTVVTTNIIEWVSRLNPTLLKSNLDRNTATLPEVIDKVNEILNNLSEREIIYSKQTPTQGFSITQRYDPAKNPMTDPGILANPFDNTSWPSVEQTSTFVKGTGVIVPGRQYYGNYFWETRFILKPTTVPFRFKIKVGADDAIAIKNITGGTEVLKSWIVAADPGYGGGYRYSDEIQITGDTEFLMVSANARPPNAAYSLGISYIEYPLPPGGSDDTQSAKNIWPLCFIVD